MRAFLAKISPLALLMGLTMPLHSQRLPTKDQLHRDRWSSRSSDLALFTKARRSNTKPSSSIALRDVLSSHQGIHGCTLTSLGPSATPLGANCREPRLRELSVL